MQKQRTPTKIIKTRLSGVSRWQIINWGFNNRQMNSSLLLAESFATTKAQWKILKNKLKWIVGSIWRRTAWRPIKSHKRLPKQSTINKCSFLTSRWICSREGSRAKSILLRRWLIRFNNLLSRAPKNFWKRCLTNQVTTTKSQTSRWVHPQHLKRYLSSLIWSL